MGAELHDSIANDMNQIKALVHVFCTQHTRILVCPLLVIDCDLLSARLWMARTDIQGRSQPANTWFDVKHSWLHKSDWFI